jgi:hypothetical protein
VANWPSWSWLLIGCVGSWFCNSAMSICMKSAVVKLPKPDGVVLLDVPLVLELFDVELTADMQASLP